MRRLGDPATLLGSTKNVEHIMVMVAFDARLDVVSAYRTVTTHNMVNALAVNSDEKTRFIPAGAWHGV